MQIFELSKHVWCLPFTELQNEMLLSRLKLDWDFSYTPSIDCSLKMLLKCCLDKQELLEEWVSSSSGRLSDLLTSIVRETVKTSCRYWNKNKSEELVQFSQ